MSELSPTQGCSYTDGPQYVGCQVAERGWPMPQGGGGKRSKSRKCSRCGKKRHQKGCSKKSMGGKRSKRGRKGGFLSQAVVQFGLFALQKRTQNRRGSKSAKKSLYARRSKRNRRSKRR